jgi:hypothetical protein
MPVPTATIQNRVRVAMDAARPSIAADAVRQLHELRIAEDEVRVHGFTVPAGITAPDSVYAHALIQMGRKVEHPAAARAVFRTIMALPKERRRLAQDSDGGKGFASRFPNAGPARVV